MAPDPSAPTPEKDLAMRDPPSQPGDNHEYDDVFGEITDEGPNFRNVLHHTHFFRLLQPAAREMDC